MEPDRSKMRTTRSELGRRPKNAAWVRSGGFASGRGLVLPARTLLHQASQRSGWGPNFNPDRCSSSRVTSPSTLRTGWPSSALLVQVSMAESSKGTAIPSGRAQEISAPSVARRQSVSFRVSRTRASNSELMSCPSFSLRRRKWVREAPIHWGGSLALASRNSPRCRRWASSSGQPTKASMAAPLNTASSEREATRRDGSTEGSRLARRMSAPAARLSTGLSAATTTTSRAIHSLRRASIRNESSFDARLVMRKPSAIRSLFESLVAFTPNP